MSNAAGTRRNWAILSVAVGFAMLAGKWAAFWLTGSHAILSDALESVVHIAATVFALFSLIVAARPPDPRYPYGYGRIEFFSAGFEGGLIALASAAIMTESIKGLVAPSPLRQLDVGMALIALASLINLALGWGLIHQGRKTRSLILEADGHHVLSDSYTSLGVLLGVGLVRLTRWWWLDSFVAIMLAIVILATGCRLTRQAFLGLMGRADPTLLKKVVTALQQGRDTEWLDLHNLRAWRSGDRTFVDFHLVVPADWTVAQLHETHVKAREMIENAVGGPVDSIIHFDPHRPDRPTRPGEPWTIEAATRPIQAAPPVHASMRIT